MSRALVREIARRYQKVGRRRRAWDWEPLRREYSERLADASAEDVIALARELFGLRIDGLRWFASSLIHAHPGALGGIHMRDLEALGEDVDSWGATDAFCSIAGPAWVEGRLSDARLQRWARSSGRWWRRSALVCTISKGPRGSPFRRLYAKPRGAHLDVTRTLAVCALLVDDRDDMVEKALSWVLRDLSEAQPRAVRVFVARNAERLPARVKREVGNKLATGLKNPRRTARLG